MSESVTNVQIEDVLSSIRKLVSEEVRAQTRAQTREAEVNAAESLGAGLKAVAPAQGDGEDRLLLTPALRVPPSDGTDQSEAPFIHAEEEDGEADLLHLMDRVRAAGEKTADFGHPRVVAEAPAPDEVESSEEAIRAALFSLGQETLAEDGGTVEDDGRAYDIGFDTDDAHEDLISDDMTDIADSDVAFADTDEAEATEVPRFLHRSGISSLGQRIAEVETVVTSTGGDWEPEADEEGDSAPDPEVATVPWEDELAADEADEDVGAPVATAFAPIPEAAVGPEGDWRVAHDPKERDFQDDPKETVEPEVIGTATAPEEDPTFVGERAHMDMQADLSDADGADLSDTVFEDEADNAPFEHVAFTAPRDAAEAEARPESIVHRSDRAYDLYEDERETLAADDTALIDEEILRDMVAEIVRQELQGALGERITRNVRKLVRREIHRALSAQDL